MEITNDNEYSKIVEKENIDKMICEGKQVEALKIVLSLAPMESNNTQEKDYFLLLLSLRITWSRQVLA